MLSFGAEYFVFHFTIQNVKIKIHRTVTLFFGSFGCETWSLTLRKERRIKVFMNKVLRRIFGSRRMEGSGEDYIMRSIILRTPDQILFGLSIKNTEMGRACRAYGER